MTDVHEAIRDYLLTTTLAQRVGSRIYAGRDVPPPGYKPTDGPCVVFRARGGDIRSDEALVQASIQCRCYGVSERDAYVTYNALVSALHARRGGLMRWAFLEIIGQPMTEPATGWDVILSFFSVWISKEPL